MKFNLDGPCQRLATNGFRNIIRQPSKLPVAGRVFVALPVAIAAIGFALTVGVVASIVDRVAKPILKSANILKEENGENFSRKHKIAAWALMLPKLALTIPAAAVGIAIGALLSPLAIIGFTYLVISGKGKNVGRPAELTQLQRDLQAVNREGRPAWLPTS